MKFYNLKINGIYHSIKKTLTSYFLYSKEKLEKQNGCFELISCDFVIDSNLNSYLLDIDRKPLLEMCKKKNIISFKNLATKIESEVQPKILWNV